MVKLNKQQQKTYDLIVKTLRQKNLRLTDVRLAIIKNLITSDHSTVASIVSSLEEEYDKINVMSVYNTLDLLLSEHIVSANTFNGKQISYEIILKNAIHFTCSVCQKIFHVDLDDYDEELTTILNKIGKKIDFKVDHYKIEVHGLCHDHQKKTSETKVFLG